MTRISIARHDEGLVRVGLTPGLLQPRLINRDADGAHVALVAGGAMLLGGDRVAVDVHVGEGCTLELEDIGGTVAYECQDEPSRLDIRIRLDAGARLVWRAHPFVVTDGADVDRTTDVVMAEGSVLLLRETLVLGRSGERGGMLRASTRARTADGDAILLEDLALDGAVPLAGVLGGHRVLDTVIQLGRRAGDSGSDPGADVVPPHASTPGLTALPVHLQLDAPGTLARTVGDAAHATGIDALADVWARELLAGDGLREDTTRPEDTALRQDVGV